MQLLEVGSQRVHYTCLQQSRYQIGHEASEAQSAVQPKAVIFGMHACHARKEVIPRGSNDRLLL